MSTEAESWRFNTMGKGIPGQGFHMHKFWAVKKQDIQLQIAQDTKSKEHIFGNIKEESERWLRDLMFHGKVFLIYFSLEAYALKRSSSVH